MSITLHTLMIFASDLDDAKTFYCDTLGLQLEFASADHIVLSFGNGTLIVYRCEKDREVGDYANEARSVFVFAVPDLEAKMAIMQANGVRFLHEVPAQNEWGRYAAFVDPFGNVHELFEGSALTSMQAELTNLS